MGSAFYPSSQWERVEALWESMYPLEGLPDESRKVIDLLQERNAAVRGFINVVPAGEAKGSSRRRCAADGRTHSGKACCPP